MFGSNTEEGKTFQGQHPDEEVLLVFRQHPIVLRKALLIFLGLFAVGSLPLAIFVGDIWPFWVLLTAFTTGLLVLFYHWIGWYFSVYILTEQRLIKIKQSGFFDRRIVDIALNRIQSVNYEIRGLQATMFNFGTIVVQTFVGDLVIEYVHHPADVQEQIVRIMHEVTPVDPSTIPQEEIEEFSSEG